MADHLLTAIGVSIIAAATFALLARRLRQPLILGYIVGGALLGPHVGLGVVVDEAAIETISEIGLILLLFIIGVEMNIPRLLPAALAAEHLHRLLRDPSEGALETARAAQARELFDRDTTRRVPSTHGGAA